jgi:thiamine-monophosphate kinase
VWIGDDAAVLRPPDGPLLLATDALVEGVHWDPEVIGADEAGWKALAVNVSDLAAMGGRPLHAVVTVSVPRGRAGDLDRLYDGLEEAAKALDCPVVGGDLTGGPALVVTVAVTGTVDGAPVLRSGARPDDALLVTGPLGAASSALRERRAGRRVAPRVAEGSAARLGGATAMIDLSDGLLIDLRRLAEASAVGVVVDDVPVAEGATRDDALGGGDDYELLLAAPSAGAVRAAFEGAGLTPPVVIGRCTADPGERRLGDGPLPEGGWEHDW